MKWPSMPLTLRPHAPGAPLARLGMEEVPSATGAPGAAPHSVPPWAGCRNHIAGAIRSTPSGLRGRMPAGEHKFVAFSVEFY